MFTLLLEAENVLNIMSNRLKSILRNCQSIPPGNMTRQPASNLLPATYETMTRIQLPASLASLKPTVYPRNFSRGRHHQ